MNLFPHDCAVVFLPCFFNNFLKKKLLDRISEARNMTHLTISFRKKKHKMTISSTEACVKHLPVSYHATRTSKAIVLLSETTTLHVHHAFLYISLPSLHDYDVKMHNLWQTKTSQD